LSAPQPDAAYHEVLLGATLTSRVNEPVTPPPRL